MSLKWFNNYSTDNDNIAINLNHVVGVRNSHILHEGQKVIEIYMTTGLIYKVLGSLEEVVARLNEKD